MAALLKYISSTNMSEGTFVSLSDSTNWNVNNAIIKNIRISTLSTDWDFYIGCADDFLTGIFDFIQIANHDSGIQNIYLDLPFIDHDASESVHCYFWDYSGSETCDVEVFGQKARIT